MAWQNVQFVPFETQITSTAQTRGPAVLVRVIPISPARSLSTASLEGLEEDPQNRSRPERPGNRHGKDRVPSEWKRGPRLDARCSLTLGGGVIL